MHDGEKIGVGIVTCNRRESYRRLFDQVKDNPYVDFVITVKNKDFDYGQDDPQFLYQNSNRLWHEQVSEDVGVGFCKNVCLKKMLDEGCQHIFLIEDDILIKNGDVFKEYIETAKEFHLEHLIFGAVYTPPSWEIDNIVMTVKSEKSSIDLYQNLHGGFVYFTRKCIQYAGLFDERFINAVEHIDHTYRIIQMGLYTPFWSFADIHDSQKYLEDSQPSNPSTINDNPLKKQRTIAGFKLFYDIWGKTIGSIPRSSQDKILQFLNWRKTNV